ncbi:MAG: NRDE family protein [Acidimicrobiales bacterium]
MCTVLVRFAPGERCPVVIGAIRDEFADRAWDPPDAHWTGPAAHLLGGRDRTAGGTWLAVDSGRPAVAALLNGLHRPPQEGGPRPTRGDLALQILTHGELPADLGRFDLFHLLLATVDRVQLWTWDAELLHHIDLEPGAHIVVNAGLDTNDDPLVPHFTPLLEVLGTEPRAWKQLLAGDGLDPADERALVVGKELDGRRYASTSATLVALAPDGIRYDFTATPADPTSWVEVPTG